MTSIISTDKAGHAVVWRMTPEEARIIAEFFENNLLPHDYGQTDAKSLRIAANELEPPEHFDHSDTVTDEEIEHELEQRAHYDGLERDRG